MAEKASVLVYGGKGNLGTICVSRFKSNHFWVASVDRKQNTEADVNILVNRDNDSLEKEESEVMRALESALEGSKLDAVICVAGGCMGGNATKDLGKSSEMTWRQSVWSSLISAAVAARHLKEGGLLTLTGATAALGATPSMIGYGMAKAAVHQLTKSLASEGSGMPANSVAVAVLPTTLDTTTNRNWMKHADLSTWTPLDFVADIFLDWTNGRNRPDNGSLLQLVTKDFKTDIIPDSSIAMETTLEQKKGIAEV